MADNISNSTDRVVFDTQLVSEIIRVIEAAEDYVVLVSPYVTKVKRVQDKVLEALSRGVSVLLVVRRSGSKLGGSKGEATTQWFTRAGAKVDSVPNLHAKLYLNERTAIVSTMNLVLSSVNDSHEAGTILTGAGHATVRDYVRRTLSTQAKFTEVTGSSNRRADSKLESADIQRRTSESASPITSRAKSRRDPKMVQKARRGKRWTSEEHALAESRLRNGESANGVAKILGRTPNAVTSRFSDLIEELTGKRVLVHRRPAKRNL